MADGEEFDLLQCEVENTEDLYSLFTEDELLHYGMPRRSGRYPWGSGDQPYQRSGDFLSRVEELKKQGLTELEIVSAMNLESSTRLRALVGIAIAERKSDLLANIKSLEADGYNRVQIAEKLGLKGESTVRSLLRADAEARMQLSEKTALTLKQMVDEKGMLDVGVGTEKILGVSKEKMREALEILTVEGYEVYSGRVPQATNPGKHTTVRVLCPPGTPNKDIYNYGEINQMGDYVSYDGGDTFQKGFKYPKSMDSNRITIRYNEEGGAQKDGIVELRKGVADISLGNSHYSQVRILVDGTHYIKGMAMYSDDMPPGIDIVFNTNKKIGTDKLDVLKKIKDDPDNPFGSLIKEVGGQSYYIDENGKKQLSLINKRADEGDWGEWSKELASQFLGKQPLQMINKQLNLALKDKQDEYDEIMSLTNPTVKKALLISYADDCDASSVSLKAASLPGTTYKVILPLVSLKDNEVYAPHLKEGSQAALIRFPHGGTFEIPILTVNNRNKEGISLLSPNPADAIGINSNVAAILSGADFDGDTVQVIPLNDKVKVKATPPLKGLEGFDAKLSYGPTHSIIDEKTGRERFFRGDKEISIMKKGSVQSQMGIISNLITDMTLKGATDEEKARAVKHSMVVIDAEKHHLDYKKSEYDNGIKLLHKKYQLQQDEITGSLHMGASTLLSKAKKEIRVPERKEGAFFARDTGNLLTVIDEKNKIYLDEKSGKVYDEKGKKTLYIDPITGEKLFHETGREYFKVIYKGKDGKNTSKPISVNKDGNMYYKDEDGKYVMVTNEKIVKKQAETIVTLMENTKNAYTLTSKNPGTPKEEAYAEYANNLKALANKARLDYLAIKEIDYSPSARIAYDAEYRSLNHKKNIALLNAPKERHAQTIAASIIKAKKQADPKMTSEQFMKMSQQELTKARHKVGAQRTEIVLTQREWEAIQSGAISKTMLGDIVKYANLDVLRQLAMPRAMTVLSEFKIRRLKNMAASGYTSSEIAESLGISPSTVSSYLREENNN